MLGWHTAEVLNTRSLPLCLSNSATRLVSSFKLFTWHGCLGCSSCQAAELSGVVGAVVSEGRAWRSADGSIILDRSGQGRISLHCDGSGRVWTGQDYTHVSPRLIWTRSAAAPPLTITRSTTATRSSQLSWQQSRITPGDSQSRWTRQQKSVSPFASHSTSTGSWLTFAPACDCGPSLLPADIIKAELEEKQFKVKLTVIDTPGFGDYVNNRESWQPIVDFIVRRRLPFPSAQLDSATPLKAS